jgi:integrase
MLSDTLLNDYQSYIQTKNSLGYSTVHCTYYLKHFLEFCKNNYPKEPSITKEMVDTWLLQRSFNTNATQIHAISDLRGFARFQNATGKTAYIPDEQYSLKVEKFYPYIFTDSELQILFNAIDSIPPHFSAPNKELIVPVLFRMMFCCGMRPSEPLHLKVEDVNLNNGMLFIRQSKQQKDRRLIMSEELLQLCRRYDSMIGPREWFFQKWDGGAFPVYWMTNQFHICRRNSGLEKQGKPRPYDLRHNYATRTLMKWIDEKRDIMALLPYLSTYMGHKKFTHTLYYIHLLPQRLRSTAGIDWERLESIYGEVTANEEN